MTGCDANSGSTVRVRSPCMTRWRRALWRDGSSRGAESLDLEVEQLFEFTRHVIYGDNKSSTIAEACAAKWKRRKNKLFIRLPPDADSLCQLLGVSNAPPVPETPSLATRTWLGTGGWSSLSPCLPHVTCSPDAPIQEGDDDVQGRMGDAFGSDYSESSEAEYV